MVLTYAASPLFGIAEYAIERGSKKLRGSKDIQEYLQREESFVVTLEQIVSCEKFGGLGSLGKHRFVRFRVADYSGTRVSYCIYAHDTSQQGSIKYWKWHDAIRNIVNI